MIIMSRCWEGWGRWVEYAPGGEGLISVLQAGST